MLSKGWMEEYNRVKEKVEELNSTCCRDNHIVCSMCKRSKECMIISAVRGVINIK